VGTPAPLRDSFQRNRFQRVPLCHTCDVCATSCKKPDQDYDLLATALETGSIA